MSSESERSDAANDRHPAARPAPLPLTAEDEPCPNCGAALAGASAVLCTACGYDLGAARARATVVGRPIEAPASETSSAERPSEGGAGLMATIFGSRRTANDAATDVLVRTPGVRLPLVIAGGCAAIMVAGHLAGAPGLFQRVDGLFDAGAGVFDAARPPWPARFHELGRWGVHVLLAWVASCAALLVVAQLRRCVVGDLATAAARLAAIILAASLLGLVAFRSRLLEGVVEPLGQGAVFVAGHMLWLRLRGAEAVQALAVMVLAALGIAGLSWIVAWSV